MATAEDQKLVLEPAVPFSYEERVELRRVFESKAFKKALLNCRHGKPSADIPFSVLNSAIGGIVANNRLHEIRGWEKFERELARQANDPAAKLTVPVDDYRTPV